MEKMMSNKKSIKDVMLTGEQVPKVASGTYFRTALENMNEHKLGVVCVVDANNKLLGIMTDGDIRRIFLTSQAPLPQLFIESINNLMIKNPITVSPDQSVSEGLQLMNDKMIWIIPTVDSEGKCVGIFHMQWALKEYLQISNR